MPHVQPQATQQSPLRTAIVGLRHNHINSVISYARSTGRLQLIAIVESDRTIREKAGYDLGLPTYESVEHMLEHESVEAAVLAPANSEKTRLALTCLRAGLHILIDKPMAVSFEELEALYEAVTKSTRVVSLMLTLRFTPIYVTAHRLIKQGVIGSLVHTWMVRPHKLTRQSRPDWMFQRANYGGLIPDLLIHDIDVFRWITGAKQADIARLFAVHGNYGTSGEADFEDAAHVLLRLHTGTVGSFEASWLTPNGAPYHGDCRAIFTGTRGVVEVHTVQNQVILTTDDAPPTVVPLDASPRVEDDFLMGIYTGRERMVFPPEEALESTAWTLLARSEADRNGRFHMDRSRH